MIQDYIGKPFIDGGRGPDNFDCWGLVKYIYEKEYKIYVEDYFISALDTLRVAETMATEKILKWEKINMPEESDLVTISMDFTRPRGFVNHVGIYLGDGKFIHTRLKTGALIENINDIKWKSRIEGYYRYVQ